MTEQWQEDETTSAQVRDDDADTPDDWEAELEEKPKPTTTDEKPKAPATTKNKANKKKFTDNDSTSKIIHEPEGDFTPEQMDQMEKKGELQKEHEKLNMAAELVDKDGPRQSLDNLNLISRDEFLNYSLRLSNHLDVVSKSEFYPDFLENFLDGITKSMSVDGVKRLHSTLQVISIRKQGEERERKSKSKAKKQARPQLKPVRQSDFGAFGNDDEQDFDQDDDYDDFM